LAKTRLATLEKTRVKGARSPIPSETNTCTQNLAAKSIKCKICFQDFQSTAKRPALEEHASNKHSKKYEDCFPAAA
jgi:hypothetical protein